LCLSLFLVPPVVCEFLLNTCAVILQCAPLSRFRLSRQSLSTPLKRQNQVFCHWLRRFSNWLF
jgi:hypothetical protein